MRFFEGRLSLLYFAAKWRLLLTIAFFACLIPKLVLGHRNTPISLNFRVANEAICSPTISSKLISVENFPVNKNGLRLIAWKFAQRIGDFQTSNLILRRGTAISMFCWIINMERFTFFSVGTRSKHPFSDTRIVVIQLDNGNRPYQVATIISNAHAADHTAFIGGRLAGVLDNQFRHKRIQISEVSVFPVSDLWAHGEDVCSQLSARCIFCTDNQPPCSEIEKDCSECQNKSENGEGDSRSGGNLFGIPIYIHDPVIKSTKHCTSS